MMHEFMIWGQQFPTTIFLRKAIYHHNFHSKKFKGIKEDICIWLRMKQEITNSRELGNGSGGHESTKSKNTTIMGASSSNIWCLVREVSL